MKKPRRGLLQISQLKPGLAYEEGGNPSFFGSGYLRPITVPVYQIYLFPFFVYTQDRAPVYRINYLEPASWQGVDSLRL